MKTLILDTFLAVHNQFVIAFSDCARLLFMLISSFFISMHIWIFFFLIAPSYLVKKSEGFLKVMKKPTNKMTL